MNGSDYLLKPCNEEELKPALEKFRNNAAVRSDTNLPEAIKPLNNGKHWFKERFTITVCSGLLSLLISLLLRKRKGSRSVI